MRHARKSCVRDDDSRRGTMQLAMLHVMIDGLHAASDRLSARTAHARRQHRMHGSCTRSCTSHRCMPRPAHACQARTCMHGGYVRCKSAVRDRCCMIFLHVSESQIRVRGKRICAKFGSRPIPLGTWSPRVQSLMIEAAKTFLSVAGW